jgi:hypothetical protein
MAALQDSACDLDFQVEIGLFWCGDFVEILAQVNFVFELNELFRAMGVLFPKRFYGIVELGWEHLGYDEFCWFLILHNGEVSG